MNQQISLFPLPDYEPDFTPDCWETPDNLALRMASLICKSDRRILETSAGSGQIAQYLPPGAFCCEIRHNRVQRGSEKAPQCHWWCADFLSLLLGKPPLKDFEGLELGFDLLITNPPFSKAISFIQHGLSLLNKDNPNARLLYLLPNDFACSKGRGTALQALDCHIHHVYWVMDRIAYIRNGKPHSGRQIYDSVFEIRSGKQKTGAISFL